MTKAAVAAALASCLLTSCVHPQLATVDPVERLWIPTEAQDNQPLCLDRIAPPYDCRTVGEVRTFIRSLRATP